MRRLVTVGLSLVGPRSPGPPGPGYVLDARAFGESWRYAVAVPDGGREGPPSGGVFAVDEHLAVDADRCRDRWTLECADVLHGSRPRPAHEALPLLARILAGHPGCRLAALPLTGGGWAAAGGAVPGAFLVPCAAAPDRSLLPSCLHAWLAAGHGLGELVPRSQPAVSRSR
ncbi:hypothetical protein [Streptomyces sp. NPDC014894]|uniref:hypothetical protein n=1 Tax=Streptomyces sp. NPDC014894 TaxID=3364931 RepID=UPI0036F6D71F